MTLVRGEAARSVSVTITRSGGFVGAVSLSVEGLPSGVGYQVDGGGSASSATLLFTAELAAVATSGVNVVVRGSGVGIAAAVERSLTVLVADPETDPGPDPESWPDDPLPPELMITQYGVVSLAWSPAPIGAGLAGAFLRMDPTPLSELRAFSPTPMCMVLTNLDDPPEPWPSGLMLNAGASLSVHTTAGSILLHATPEPDSWYSGYVADTTLPQGTLLTVPGGEFPRFSNVPVPPLPPLLELAGGLAPGSSVTGSTEFLWTPEQPIPGVHAYVTFMIILDGEDTGALCAGPDHGSFSLPASTIAELGGADFLGTLAMATYTLTREVVDPGTGSVLAISSTQVNYR